MGRILNEDDGFPGAYDATVLPAAPALKLRPNSSLVQYHLVWGFPKPDYLKVWLGTGFHAQKLTLVPD